MDAIAIVLPTTLGLAEGCLTTRCMGGVQIGVLTIELCPLPWIIFGECTRTKLPGVRMPFAATATRAGTAVAMDCKAVCNAILIIHGGIRTALVQGVKDIWFITMVPIGAT